jgi:hypothetical protein
MPKDQVPGVTIIRPLRGIDCNMYENLASSFRQDYPLFEIVFSVAQPNDPAITVVRDLMKQYPKVDARLIIGKQNVVDFLSGFIFKRAHCRVTGWIDRGRSVEGSNQGWGCRSCSPQLCSLFFFFFLYIFFCVLGLSPSLCLLLVVWPLFSSFTSFRCIRDYPIYPFKFCTR